MSRKMLFPRFQAERPEPSVDGRGVDWRAEPRPWTTATELDMLIHPKKMGTIGGKRAIKDETFQHLVRNRFSGLHTIDVENFQLGEYSRTWRGSLFWHLWQETEEASAEHAIEIVLENIGQDEGMHAVMALLVDEAQLYSEHPLSRLVMRPPQGEWVEPLPPGQIDDWRDLGFLLLNEVIERPSEILQP